MKDDRLEKQFAEYFENVNTPCNITADAKKYVKPKNAYKPTLVKFLCAAASFALVLTVSLTVFFNVRFSPSDNLAPEGGRISYYEETELSYIQTDVYGVSKIDHSLNFIKNLAYGGANVKDCEVGYRDGNLAIVKTEISMLHSLSRYDAEIFVEFTDVNSVYSPLKDYREGTVGKYRDVDYYLTRETSENGEPVNKLHFVYGGTKYYFRVASADENSYIKCLEMIIK